MSTGSSTPTSCGDEFGPSDDECGYVGNSAGVAVNAQTYVHGWAVMPRLREEIALSNLLSRLEVASAKNSSSHIAGLQKFISCAFKSASNMCGPGSNVPYVSLVLSAVEHWPGVCSVQAGCGGDSVDIVTSRGLNWTLLSAASSRRLPRVFNQGLAQKIVRLLQRARCCPIFYSSPRIFFSSLHPLPGRIRAWLNQVGVSVVGNLGPESVATHDASQAADCCDCEDDDSFLIPSAPPPAADAADAFPLWCATWTPTLIDLATRPCIHPFAPPVTFLLDATACIALVSAVTADESVLRLPPSSFSIEFNRWQQSDELRVLSDCGDSTRSLISTLLASANRVVVSAAAWQVFNSIVNTIGGPGERSRRDSFLREMRCEVIPDVPYKILQDSQVKLGKHKHTHTLTIFATSLATKSVIVTSNAAFLNAAWQTARIHIPAVLHPARALFKA